jgi:hypothetical protein
LTPLLLCRELVLGWAMVEAPLGTEYLVLYALQMALTVAQEE